MKSIGYKPQLDGLRCMAVLAVLFHHFWQMDTGVGLIGVRLFFVLSGFLITTMLLSAKELIESDASWHLYEKHWNALKGRLSDSFSSAVTPTSAADSVAIPPGGEMKLSDEQVGVTT